MSKTTSYKPSYSNGSVSINGQNKASTVKSGNTVFGNYNMNDYEKELYDYAQKTLPQLVQNVNTFSPEVMQSMNKQLDVYKQQGQNYINQIYKPMIDNLKNDIASRFGNLDNSMFMNNLNNIESSRSDAISQLANDLISRQNEFVNNELANRYNYINLLNSLQNQYNNYALNMLNSSMGLGNTGLAYNNSVANNNNSSNTFNLEQIASLASLAKYFI